LREAYAKVLKDPALLDQAKTGKMDVEFTSGEALAALTREVLEQPSEVIEQARKIVAK
jgi:hypothetical protein